MTPGSEISLLLIFIPAVVVAITLHEFAHALIGHYLGDDTARLNGRLSLNPLVHIDPLLTVALPLMLLLAGSPIVFGAARPVPFNPWAVRYGKWGAALIAAAGPLTNLLVALFLGFWLHLVTLSPGAVAVLVGFIQVNIGFFIFNLIPFPPLDGSRVLYAAAPLWLRTIMDQIEQAGIVGVIIFLLIAYTFLLPIMGDIALTISNWLIPNAPGI